MIKPTIPLASLLFLTFTTSMKNNNSIHVCNENSTIFYRSYKFAILTARRCRITDGKNDKNWRLVALLFFLQRIYLNFLHGNYTFQTSIKNIKKHARLTVIFE